MGLSTQSAAAPSGDPQEERSLATARIGDETQSSQRWATARGEKWRAALAGMEAMLAPVDEPLIAALQLTAPCRIADIGCGGGGTASEIFRQAPERSEVHGFDISPLMIEAARPRAHGAEPSLTFTTLDVATAAPPATPFDRLVSRFGVMFFEDPALAFGNLFRWLAPQGRAVFAVWGRESENQWMSTVREVVGHFCDIPLLRPDAPGPFRYAEVDTLLVLLEHAGFRQLKVNSWRGQLPIGGGLSAAAAARFALTAFSSFGELLAAAGPGAFSAAQQLLTERFTSHERSGAVWLDASVLFIAGTRSGRTNGEGPERGSVPSPINREEAFSTTAAAPVAVTLQGGLDE